MLFAAETFTVSPVGLLVVVLLIVGCIAAYKVGWLDMRILVTVLVIVAVAWFFFGWRV